MAKKVKWQEKHGVASMKSNKLRKEMQRAEYQRDFKNKRHLAQTGAKKK